MIGGLSPASARAPKFFMSISRFFACFSMSAPVPAAQAQFISKSAIVPFLSWINFESCPPISMMVISSSLKKVEVPLAWAVISSLIWWAPIK